tara:strand:+ start:219 stop:452 length:234 start_codon:yes stop_codon:yes gene_type:complete
MYANRKYVILNASETGSINFSQVLESSVDTLRFNLSASQTFVKFDGDTPSFLSGKTAYNYKQIINILSGPEWTEEGE